MNYKELINAALESRKMAYVPYSGFAVGAALLCKDGTIVTGCNIENASYSPTNCAERTAFFKAVSEGHRDFIAIAIVGDYKHIISPRDYCAPCGVCRQVMVEFTDEENFNVILAKNVDDYKTYKLKELLPLSFSNKSLIK